MGKINEVISNIKPINTKLEEEAQSHLDNLTKPRGSLGKLEWLAKKIIGITGTMRPRLKDKVIFTMAGDHGIAEEGVSAFPQEVTPQMVYNFINGGAAINVLARHAGARVIVIDMGVKEDIKSQHTNFINKKINYGTKNFTKGPAMTRDEAVRSIEAGVEAFNERSPVDLLGVGDMGIANTTSSAAIAACITGEKVELIVGRGTGINDEQLKNKIRVIKKALPVSGDAIDILSKVGGFEIGGIAGAILAGAAKKIPVVIDGFIATAGALIAYKLAPNVKPYLISSHKSKELGHRIMLNYLELEPILDLDLRLGEGTGSALAMNIIDAAFKIFNEMATFKGAGVSEKSQDAIHGRGAALGI